MLNPPKKPRSRHDEAFTDECSKLTPVTMMLPLQLATMLVIVIG